MSGVAVILFRNFAFVFKSEIHRWFSFLFCIILVRIRITSQNELLGVLFTILGRVCYFFALKDWIYISNLCFVKLTSKTLWFHSFLHGRMLNMGSIFAG